MGREISLEQITALFDEHRFPKWEPKCLVVPPLDTLENEVLEVIAWLESEGCEVYESKTIEPDMVYSIEVDV